MIPAPVERLVDQLARLPGIGRKTAARLAFHIIGAEEGYAADLAGALVVASEGVGPCSDCGFLTDSRTDPCRLCTDPRRDDAVMCVVEGTPEVVAVESTGAFRGRYHTLGGVLSPLEGIGPDRLRIAALLQRLESGIVKELIVATRPTVDGEATAHFLASLVRDRPIVCSRIASGVPIGASLEHADQVTLARALEGRRPVE